MPRFPSSTSTYPNEGLRITYQVEHSNVGVEWCPTWGPKINAFNARGCCSMRSIHRPLKCVLRQTIPELEPELAHVVNTFDPWARDRGEYYDSQWKPREDAKGDPAFASIPFISKQGSIEKQDEVRLPHGNVASFPAADRD